MAGWLLVRNALLAINVVTAHDCLLDGSGRNEEWRRRQGKLRNA